MKKYFPLHLDSLLILLFLIVDSSNLYSQVTASDCVDAINVCTNLGFQISPNGSGNIPNEVPTLGSAGNPNNNNPGGSGNKGCLKQRERNSTWMIINIATPGVLEFNFGGIQQSGYYDWAMWPYNANSCSQIPSGSVPPVRCNWNEVAWGGTGLAATTPNDGHPENFEPPLNVQCGDRFIICFSNYSSVNTTVPLSFFGTATVSCDDIFDLDIITSVTPSEICEGESVTITAQGGTGVTWSPSVGLNSTSGTAVTATPNVTTTYTATGTTPCGVKSDSVTVTVRPVPVVTLSAFNPLCIDAGTINLTGGLPAGGTYSGPGVNNGVFNPQTAGVGTHTITYSYSNGTCTEVATQTITVNPLPATPSITQAGPFCCGSNPINLSGNPSGGVWTGVPIISSVNGTLDPACVNAGTHVITYTNVSPANCTSSTTTTVVISPQLTANAGNSVSISSGQSTTLTGAANGGTGNWAFNWTPSNRVITPTSMSTPTTNLTSSQTFTFNVTDAINCQSSGLVNVIVIGGALNATISASPTLICPGETVQLNVLPSGGNGTYSYNWTASTGAPVANIPNPIVNPTANTTYTVTVTSAGNSVTRSITVNMRATPNVSLTAFNDVCITGQPFALSGGSPAGGTYTGNGVFGANFNPQVAGVGNHTITYTVTGNNGCNGTATRNIQVIPLPNVNLSVQPSLCENDNPITLSGGTPLGGTYFGPGVANGVFDPNLAGPGNHTVFYNYAILGTANCEATDTRTIVVHPKPNVDLPLPDKMCVNDPDITLNMGTPTGGFYFGSNGILGGMVFSAPDAGFGTHDVIYSVTSPQGCTSNDTAQITVNPLPQVQAIALPNFCINSLGEPLPQGTPAGGIYTGPGLTLGDSIFPALAGLGSQTLIYQYTDTNNCTNTSPTTTTVLDTTPITFTMDTLFCENDSSITLSALPATGSFSGPGITGSSFDPSVAGVGIHYIKYEATNPNGCISRDSIRVEVVGIPNVVLSNLDSICYDADAIILTQGSPVNGTYIGNGIINNNEFDPDSAQLGVNEIIYTFTNNAGCTNSDTNQIYVIGRPSVSHDSIAPVCISKNPFTITGGNPSGGVYSGNGVNNNIFNPSVTGVGIHPITYIYTSPQGCRDTLTTFIEVLDLPVVSFIDLPDVCIDDNEITLNSATPVGGIYSGNGVSNNIFYPDSAGDGLQQIIYTYTDSNTSCTNFDTAFIRVNPLPVVNFPPLADICVNDSGFVLNTATPSDSGGVYSGIGVTNDFFNPEVATPGFYTLTYTYTDSNTCVNFDTSNIVVHDTATITFTTPSDVCIDADTFTLSFASPNGGIYSGNGINNNIFNPSIAGVGTHAITYTFTNSNNCVTFINTEITVNDLPVLNFNDLPDVCIDDNEITLNTATPAGGDYSGNGISNNIFYPDSAGDGLHQIIYTYTDSNSCTNFDTAFIRVNPLPVVNFSSPPNICVNDSGFVLSSATPSGNGGVYTGVGVNNGFFNPEQAGAGNHTLTYTYTDSNSCVNFDTTLITVLDTTTLTFANLPDVCVDADTFTLNTATPTGGIYTGNGISNNIFSPSVAGVGTHTIRYTYTNSNACTNFIEAEITVNYLPVVNFPNNTTICVDHVDFEITTATPFDSITGIYSGVGITNNVFSPSTAGVGTYTQTYTYTDTNGCVNSDTATFIVNDLPVVNLPAFNDVCLNEPPFFLNTGTPFSGIYSGNGIVNGNNFNASNAGLGTHNIVYEYTDNIGCVNKDSTDISVLPFPNISISSNDTIICFGDTSTLSPSGGINYTWSTTFGNVVPGNGVVNVSPQFTTNYILRGENNLGCANRDTIRVLVNQLPNITLNSPSSSICPDDTTTITASGGVSYVWSPLNNIINVNNHTITVSPTSNATYNVIGTDVNGCENTASLDITLFPKPNITATASFDTICLGENTVLSGGGASSYVWSPNQNLNNTINQSVTSTPSNNITYTVTGTTSDGCVGNANVSITVNSLPQLNISSSNGDSLCVGQNTTLNVGGANNYVWTPGATLDTTQGNTVVATPSLTTTYLVTGIASSGCKSDTSITIHINPPLTLLAAGDEICFGDTATLSSFASGGDGNYSFEWTPNLNITNPNSNLTTVAPEQTTTYTVTVNDNCGTSPVSQQVNVVVLNLPNVNFAVSPQNACAPLSGTLTNNTIDIANCEWYINGQFYDNNCNSSFEFNNVGENEISLFVTDIFGCKNSDTSLVEVYANPIANFYFESDSATILNSNIFFNGTISSEDVVFWDWEFSNLGIDTGRTTSFMFNDAGAYPVTLYVENENGCKDTITYFVEIKDDYAIYIPNAFTPNGDEINNTFGPVGVGLVDGVDNYVMRIFNRWGQIVYETNSLNLPWNGTTRQGGRDGNIAPNGVYIYTIRIKDLFGEEHEYTGKVTLIR